MIIENDKSAKGSLDKDIIPLLELINSFQEFETTSSCSGRIVLITSFNKKDAKWLYKTHSKANPVTIHEIIQEQKAFFLQEPFILHIKYTNLDAAFNIIKIAKESGMKHSGIVDKNNLEIRGNERMQTILFKNDKNYVNELVEEANKLLRKTKQRIAKFEEKLKIYKTQKN